MLPPLWTVQILFFIQLKCKVPMFANDHPFSLTIILKTCKDPTWCQIIDVSLDFHCDHWNNVIYLACTDRAEWMWRDTAAATASISHSSETADFQQASLISYVSPQPPSSQPGWSERLAQCQELVVCLLMGPSTDQRAAVDRDKSRIQVYRSTRVCGSTLTHLLGRNRVWSKMLSTLSYLRWKK